MFQCDDDDEQRCFDLCVIRKCNQAKTNAISGLSCKSYDTSLRVMDRICCQESTAWVQAWARELGDGAFGEEGSICVLRDPLITTTDDPSAGDESIGDDTEDGSGDNPNDLPKNGQSPPSITKGLDHRPIRHHPYLAGYEFLQGAHYNEAIADTCVHLTIEVYRLMTENISPEALSLINRTNLVSLFMAVTIWLSLTFCSSYISADAFM